MDIPVICGRLNTTLEQLSLPTSQIVLSALKGDYANEAYIMESNSTTESSELKHIYMYMYILQPFLLDVQLLL